MLITNEPSRRLVRKTRTILSIDDMGSMVEDVSVQQLNVQYCDSQLVTVNLGPLTREVCLNDQEKV